MVSRNSGPGMVKEGSRSSLRAVSLVGNGAEGLRSTSGEISLRDGMVTGQSVPVRNSDPQLRVVDARQQWWGSGDGPEGLVGPVEYDPWLGALPTAGFAVTALHASTRAFAPGTSNVRFDIELPSVAGWILRFLAPDGSDAGRLEGTGRGTAVTWDGKSGTGAVLADGTYRVRFEATEESTGRVAAPLVGRLQLDGAALPVAILTTPAGVIRGRAGDELAIEGSAGGRASSPTFSKRERGISPAAWTVIDRGALPVAAGNLGKLHDGAPHAGALHGAAVGDGRRGEGRRGDGSDRPLRGRGVPVREGRWRTCCRLARSAALVSRVSRALRRTDGERRGEPRDGAAPPRRGLVRRGAGCAGRPDRRSSRPSYGLWWRRSRSRAGGTSRLGRALRAGARHARDSHDGARCRATPSGPPG